MEKPGLLKVLSSYVFPKLIATGKSRVNPFMEVVYHRGRLRFNSRTINYSFNGYHPVFEKAFARLKMQDQKIGNMLVLGLGSGSIVTLIRQKFGWRIPVTGVEIDPEVIRLSKEFFGLGDFSNLELICADAHDHVMADPKSYDLVTMDAFIDKYVPASFHAPGFLEALTRKVNPGGWLVFNYIAFDDRTERGFQKIVEGLKNQDGEVSWIKISPWGIGNRAIVFHRHNA